LNIAFPALLLFLLILPGLLFRRGFLNPPLPATSLTDEIAWAVIPAVILHLSATALIESTTDYRVDFGTLGQLLLGVQRDVAIAADFRELGRYLRPIAYYNLLLWTVSFVLGWALGTIVYRFSLDRRYAWLKRSNDWRDLIDGRLLPRQEFDYVWLDAMVKSGSGTTIYSGIMSEFIYSADGQIEAVVFREALKWMTSVSALQWMTSESELIPGAAFAIKFSEILNLNVSFVQLPEILEPPASTVAG